MSDRKVIGAARPRHGDARPGFSWAIIREHSMEVRLAEGKSSGIPRSHSRSCRDRAQQCCNTFAGSTIFLVIQGPQGLLSPGQMPWVVTDTQGNSYTQVTSAFTLANNGAQTTTFVATGTTAAALTATVSTTFRN